MTEFQLLTNLLKEDRSVRIFDESRSISKNELESLVNLTRYCASGRNLQPLKYRLVYTKEENDLVFPLLKWAGYYVNWDGPEEGERPVAYIIQCLDTRLTKNLLCDDGLQLQAITLGATALKIGCCIIKSFNLQRLKEVLGIEEYYEPLYVLALGYPKEIIKLEDLHATPEADIKYYRTKDGVHHVPKRQLNELLISDKKL